MGNCQAIEDAAAVVEHPSGKVEKVFWTKTAHQLMMQNPGHYVAITSSDQSGDTTGRRNVIVKLLPAGAPLCVGTNYRLVNFEEVFRHFAQESATKNCGSVLAESQTPPRKPSVVNRRRQVLSTGSHSFCTSTQALSTSAGIVKRDKNVVVSQWTW
eukprot:c53503_g1_i1 orf=353-820(+)